MAQSPLSVTASSSMSLEAFLSWDDGTGTLYELIEGEPMPMSDPTADHEDVADGLCDLLKHHCLAQRLPYVPKRSKLVLVGSRNGKDTARRADIVVFDAAEWTQMQGASRSAMAYQVPPLVIEVVSTNWRDDYLTKLAEYESIGVKEYWIVDYVALGGKRYIGYPKQATLSIYSMAADQTEYGEPSQFRGHDPIISSIFPELTLSAQAVFRGAPVS
ncbi:MAG: Uma2 family endonuclease [Cyanobacteria bacterium P01_G01_bin.38]